MPKVGVTNAHYAMLGNDSVANLDWHVPVSLPGVKTVDIKTGKDTATDYADNGPFAVASALGEITLDAEFSEVGANHACILLGHTMGNDGVVVKNADDTAPYVAFGFEATKSNGNSRLTWLLKGQFAEPDDTNKTKGEKVEFQSEKLSGKFVITEHDGNWEYTVDEDSPGYNDSTGTGWFTTLTHR